MFATMNKKRSKEDFPPLRLTHHYSTMTRSIGGAFLLFISLIPFTVAGQISGSVYSAKDSVALQGVAIYFDGTSIGTVTNSNGEFHLEQISITSPLVISFLGYEEIILPSPAKGKNLGKLFLNEKTEQLEEVLVEPDTWSREKKLNTFIREFLGNTPEAAKCRIKNTEVLELRYSPTRKILTAYAREPLKIINRHLGYEISYSLTSFEAQFNTGSSGLLLVHSVSFEGTSFFKELNKKTRNKHLWNRKNSYSGSSLHFIRSLISRRLEENDFHLYHKSYRVAPYEYFEMEVVDELATVEMTAEKLSILYLGIEQSEFQTTSPFVVDEMGNHSPPLALIFGGVMAGQRIAHLLPLNYQP